MTLQQIHLALYRHFLTIYVCPEDAPEKWFIIPNPAFNGGVRLKADGTVGERLPYHFKILASGKTPQSAYADWEKRGSPDK